MTRPLTILSAGTALLLLAACEDGGFDLDLRDGLGGLDTSRAAQTATQPRPRADDRGVITYPNYQVVVAERGDTVISIADRLEIDADALARFNGIEPTTVLRRGEIIALNTRVAGSLTATATPVEPGSVDIAGLAGSAIDRAPADAARTPEVTATALPATTAAPEPIRHKVERGETAFTIARLYGVPVKALAEWNGLGSDFAVREGQFLLIPVAGAQAPAAVTEPGQGTATPTPPSSTRAEPADDTTPSQQATARPPASVAAAPDLGAEQTVAAPASDFITPAPGAVIRAYAKGRNEGIDIAAAAGTPVKAAAAGTVAAITKNQQGIPIIVIRHEGSLLTVYTQIDGVSVAKGDSVRQGQQIATVRADDPSFLHFEIRDGLDSVDPAIYLNI
ncbi:MAG: LysM peptidoglycan-binding domain-containing M23 family metallopeptidase [Pseudomonadota bacterium]